VTAPAAPGAPEPAAPVRSDSAGYLTPGSLLKGRYAIDREIGRGGLSVVYLAHDRGLGTEVAIKLLAPPPSAARTARERMRREVMAVRGLSHEHIVAIHDFLEEGPWSFIVMEYVAGPDLSIRVRDRGPLDPDEAVRLGLGIAAALEAAHRRGILHRDVKPQNVLLDPDGRARLTDFGSARLEGQATMTQTGGLVGTLNYSAPEVLAGHRGDARADLYALGMTLYFALTGRLPNRPSAQLPPPPAPDGYQPRAARPELPPWLSDVVARATAADPGDRFPSAVAFAAALGGSDRAAQAHPLPRTSRVQHCVICGGSEPFGVGLCPNCGGGSAAVADTLIFVQQPGGGSAREAVLDRVRAMLATRADAVELEELAGGHRALIRVPAPAARRVVEQLAAREIPARSVAVRSAWAPVPLKLYGLAGAVVGVGGAAGAAAIPFLLWASPLLAALLVLLGQRELQRPVVVPVTRHPTLPRDLERKIMESLARLPEGPARGLLADLVRMGSGLSGHFQRLGDRQAASELATVLEHSCDAALDLADLDDNLGRFENQRESFSTLPPGWLDALAQCERTRDALVQRLLDVMTVLGQARSVGALAPAGPGARLAEIKEELSRDVRAHELAAREVEAILTRPAQ
jgi:serine/threonine-protein kinase